jgi:tetratricopeptide (TPR) repeat protein
MKDFHFIRKDLNFYTYDKRLPFYKRLFGGSVFTPYCDQCQEWLKTYERMIGIPVPDDALINPNQSDTIKRLLDKDWSVLRSGGPIYDWSLQPLIYLGLAKCKSCDGPFSVFGEIHGKASNGIIYFGGIFLMEVEKASALELLETAIDRDLLPSDKVEAKAIEFAKAAGSQRDYAQIALAKQRKKEAMALGAKAHTYLEQGDFDRALTSFNAALDIFESLEDIERRALVRKDMGLAHYGKGNLGEAEAQFMRALSDFETIDWKEEVSSCHGLIGSISFDRENFTQAEENFLKALEISEALNRKDLMAMAFRSLGSVYDAVGKREQAKSAYTESIKLAEETGNSDLQKYVQSEIDRLNQ